MSSAPGFAHSIIATSATGPVVDVVHVCARHPGLRGDRGCTDCSNALCTACARSLSHRSCPTCRTQAGRPAHVVDASWRVQLLIDALLASVKAVPRRAPVLLTILVVALLLPLCLHGLADPDDSAGVVVAIIGGLFATAAFTIGLWLQPLLVVPTLERASKGRALVGALIGSFVALAPLVTLVMLAIPFESELGSDVVGQLVGMTFLSLGCISLPLGLVWQGRAVMGHGPSLSGSVGAVITHFCVASIWWMVLVAVCIPLGVLVGVGAVVDPVVAGVVGVASGVVVWLLLLLGMGSFAAASARYSVDLERLR